MALDPQIRTLIRSRTRTRRRSACHRHPNEPFTGFCALCLRDRLAGLDSSTGEPDCEDVVASSSSGRRIGGDAGASSSKAAPALRRSKSVAVGKCEVLNGLSLDPRRKSCEVRASNTLSDLFDIDDTKSGGHGVVRVESKNLGFSSIAEPVLEMDEDDDDDSDEIRVSDVRFVRNQVDDNDGDEIGEEDDLKTMKEYIEMELQSKKKNFWEAASVFSQKLRKWRQKQKVKKQNGGFNGGTDNNRSKLGQVKDHQSEVSDYALGRRSCDTEPRFSIDINRMSVEDPRFSLDEHRASWDGYMIARTIPRLTPMLPIVDDLVLPPVTKVVAGDNQQMHPILEDGPSSAGSAQSNSESSSSNTGSSSSSIKSSTSTSNSKTAGLEGDDNHDMKSVSKSRSNDVICQETKLVFTERELKDWRSNSNSIINTNVESASNAHLANEPNRHKKGMTNRWRKVCNLWSYKYKLGDKKNGAFMDRSNEIEGFERGSSSAKLVRNSSVCSRNRTESHPNGEFVLDRNRSSRHSMSDLDSGLLRLYLSPFRKSRRS